MNCDHIIRLATESGMLRKGDMWTEPGRWGFQELRQFAALVAAAEREACARLLDDQWFRTQSDCAAAIRARGPNEPR